MRVRLLPGVPVMHSNPRKSFFKRVKHGHVPGDISKHTKIAMREDRPDDHPTIPRRAAKGWRRELAKQGNRRIRHESTRSLFRLDEE